MQLAAGHSRRLRFSFPRFRDFDRRALSLEQHKIGLLITCTVTLRKRHTSVNGRVETSEPGEHDIYHSQPGALL